MLDKMYDVEDFMPSKVERIAVYLSIIFALLYKIVGSGYLYMMLISWIPTMVISAWFLIYRYRKISIKVRDNAQVWHALALPNQLELNNQNNNDNNDENNNAQSNNGDDETQSNFQDNNNNNKRGEIEQVDEKQVEEEEEEVNNVNNSDNSNIHPRLSGNQVPLTQFNLARRDMISDLTDFQYEKSNLWVLLIIPSVGSITYTAIVLYIKHFTKKLPTATIINIAGIIIGFVFMFVSIWRILLLNERVFLRNQYRSQLMEELEIEIEMERAALIQQESNNDHDEQRR